MDTLTKNSAKILFVVMLGFIPCWVPTLAIGVILAKMKVLPPEYSWVCVIIIYLSSAINLIIYGVMNHKFRKEFKRSLVLVKNGVTKCCSVLMRGHFKISPQNQR